MKYTIKNNITKVQRSIAYVLLLSELLTSCGFKETILPSIQPQESRPSTCVILQDTSLSASANNFQLSTTTIEGTALTFAYTPEAGLQATYQNPIMPEAVPVQQYPVIQDVTGLKKPFSQLPKAEAALLATSGKWEVNKQGGLSYNGIRGRGGMPGSGAVSSSGGGYPLAPSAAAAAPKPAYTTRDVTYDEVQEIQKQYLRCPVEGYEIATVERIESPNLQQAYDTQVDLLNARRLNSAFNPTWEAGPDAAARREVDKRLQGYVISYGLTKNPDGVKELKLWHGTDPQAAQGIIQTGFASLGTTDEGFFGQGLYFTPQAEYAHRVYGKGILLLNKVSFYSAYPVAMVADMEQLKGKSNYGGRYDAHFIPVKPAYPNLPNPLTAVYHPAEGVAPTYDELVVFQQAQALPLYKVTLQRGLTRSPKLLDRYRTLGILPITEEKLANPGKNLSLEESITVISNCLRIGEGNAKRARGKDLVIFLGNTGAGKSTTINYLYGCELEKVFKEKSPESTIRVKGSSSKKELMGIGNEKKSHTFLPEIASDPLFTYCDCPGFLDNRGAEINISNAVNIFNAISVARSIKVCLLLTHASIKNNRSDGLKNMHKMLKELFGDETRLTENIDSVLLCITKVQVEGKDAPKSLAKLYEDFEAFKESEESEEEVFSMIHTDNIVTFDPLENTIEGGLRRQEMIAKITSLPAISNPGDIFKTVINREDEQKLREVAGDLYTKIKAAIESKNYVALCEHLVTLSQLNRIHHAYVITVQTTVSSMLEQYTHDLNHDVTLFSLQEQFKEADRELASLKSLADHLLSKYPNPDKYPYPYAFVTKRYEASKICLGCAREKSEERRKQLEEIMELKNQLQGLQMQLTQQAEKEVERKAAQVALQTAIAAMSKQHTDSIAELATKQEETKAAFEKNIKKANTRDRKKLETELAAQKAAFAVQKAELEQQQSDVAKAHAKKQAVLEAYEKKLAAEKIALSSKKAGMQTAVITKVAESNLTALRGLLGNNYVGEEAWRKLGIVVTDLPPVSDRMLEEARRLETKGEQPLLVLDLGKSIAEIERLCNVKKITVLKAVDGKDANLRAETFYQAVGPRPRWLLLPGSDHGVLPGSRDKTYRKQQEGAIAADYPKGCYAVGGVRELITLAMLKHIQDGTVLFPTDPSCSTYGRCKEKYQTGALKPCRVCLGDNSGSAAGFLDGCRIHDARSYDYVGFFAFFAP